MNRFSFWMLVVLFSLGACKTADAPVEEVEKVVVAEPTQAVESSPKQATFTAQEANTTLSQEEQYKFKAFLKQGDAQYAAGDYRAALNYYKKAKAVAPEQIDNTKLVACLKALQTPSTRRKN